MPVRFRPRALEPKTQKRRPRLLEAFEDDVSAYPAIVVLRNSTPLLRLRLENFRDYDLHFVTPIVIGAAAYEEVDPQVLFSFYGVGPSRPFAACFTDRSRCSSRSERFSAIMCP